MVDNNYENSLLMASTILVGEADSQDVGMHGLLAIVNRVTILCYTPSLCTLWTSSSFSDALLIISRHP